MTFEILHKDLGARIGRLYTKSGTIETPNFFPVVNPIRQTLSVEEIRNVGFNQVITNAYLIMRHYGELGREFGVHRILNWNGPVMTDSGAYQLMSYGEIEVLPDEILRYEVEIGADIGVILDIPTIADRDEDSVTMEVEETLRRARRGIEILRLIDPEHKMLIVGPIQGGDKLRLLDYSAKAMARLSFDIYAVGSPTTILENYDFQKIIEMIMRIRRYIPHGKPVHLFGAGHPLIVPITAALGVDLYDSASYILYARDGRAMLRDRTVRLSELGGEDLPCRCTVCSRYRVRELLELPSGERERLLAIHNLNVLWEEFQETRLRIREGTLWEYIEEKCGGNAKMLSALRRLIKYNKLDLLDPETTGRVHGVHITRPESLRRPEITRYWRRLASLSIERKHYVLVIHGELLDKPYLRDPIVSWLIERLGDHFSEVHVIIYDPVLGPIPYELGDIFPTAQHEYPKPPPGYMRIRANRMFLAYLRRLRDCGSRELVVITRDARDTKIILNIGLESIVYVVNDRAHARGILEEVLGLLKYNEAVPPSPSSCSAAP